MLRLLVAVIVLSGLLPATAAGNTPVVIGEGMTVPPTPLGLHLDVLHDEHRKYTLDDVIGPELGDRFVPSRAKTLNFGFSQGAYWLRLRIESKLSQEKNLLLEATFPLIDSVDLYIPNTSGGYDTMRGGELIVGSRWPPHH